jgi:hypothetical protein
MKTANQQERRTPQGHIHAEAFCLMRYECNQCRHHEIIWNSRDGVTPFCLICPSCGDATMMHAYFGSDRYAPDYKPHRGQRVWISMTKDRAAHLARRNVLMRKKPGPETERLIEQVAGGYYDNGRAPDLRIEGYSEVME